MFQSPFGDFLICKKKTIDIDVDADEVSVPVWGFFNL